jgi:cobalt/nickel transport system permease protein
MLFAPYALHIPDGFLSTFVSIVGWAFALIMIGIAIRLTRDQLGERQIPLMGLLAAFIFAAQAINFPVAAGCSRTVDYWSWAGTSSIWESSRLLQDMLFTC